MSKYVLGLDFGTLSGRAALARVENGETVATASFDYPHGVMDSCLPSGKKLGADWALQHPQDYLDALLYIVPHVLSASGISPEDVLALGIDFTACTALPVTQEGTPLCFLPEYRDEPHAYVKLWKHHAAQPQADRMEALANKTQQPFIRRYGGKVSSEWLFPKMLQVLEEAPQVYTHAAYFLEAADWLVWLLCGRQVRSCVIAGYKAMWQKGVGYPDKEYLKQLNPAFENAVTDKLNAPLQMQGSSAGNLTPQMAQKLGLSTNTIVAVCTSDAPAGMPPTGICAPGTMLCIMGTSACHMLLENESNFVPGVAGYIEDGLVPGFTGYECNQFMGDHYAWFAENCCPASYLREAEEKGLHIQTLLSQKAEKLKVGESGLLALDWWNGNRSILVDGQLSGLMLGMTLQTKPEEMYRALVEATAYTTRMVIENYREHSIIVNRIVATGGISLKNPFIMQLFADVTGLPIDVSGAKEGAALGSAIMAAAAIGKANGGYDTVPEAMAHMAQPAIATYTPKVSNHLAYDRLFCEYRTLHDYFGRGGNDVMKHLKAMRREIKQKESYEKSPR